MSEAQQWRDSLMTACEDAVNELSDSGGDPHTIDNSHIEDHILWVEFTDGSAVYVQFVTDHTGLHDE